MNFKSKMLKRGAFALVFGAAMLFGAGATANAQGHSQKQERRDLKYHQQQERSYNGNNHATRDHQRAERDQLKNEQHAERNGYGQYNNGGYYGGNTTYNNGHAPSNGGYNNGGYYGNNAPYNNSHGHSNSGSYGNAPYYGNGGGYYGNAPYYGNNGGYNRPHRDSRNPIRRAVHHARGGH